MQTVSSIAFKPHAGRRGQEVFKLAPVHYCTDFTLTANAMVSTYGRNICRGGTLLQAVKVVHCSHPLNIHPYPLPTIATLPNRHWLAGKYILNLRGQIIDLK
ncbi:hypothetical protein RF11_11890 [Thelohanellus kitauei]|uniref:Uncharacterized protein n=1 Tax=Thelohanellus kitauei TaxID=669202 RepID=A0A0C2ND34_THEKT|nr:hypothetical protein RF11_11890 [Thelohanellus kitauei]